MTTFTVAAVDPNVRDWSSDKGGPMREYRVVFKEHPGKALGWSRKASSEPPQVGQQVEGPITWEEKFGKAGTFKQDFSSKGGGGYYKPRDPDEIAAIQRQHSQDAALQFLAQTKTFADLNVMAMKPESVQECLSLVARVSDYFQRDIQRGVNLERYGSKQETRVQGAERTGGSDLPAPGQGEFEHPPVNDGDVPFAA